MRLALVPVLMLAACAASPQPGGPIHFSGEATGGVGETIRRLTETKKEGRA